jgi:hypothetical protein
MAKKLDKKNESVEPNETKACCQYCKSHCNHPSKCKVTSKYVGRKQAACDKFKIKERN